MTLKDFADSLNGKQYGYPQFTEKEVQLAKEHGFVIVCGASDDLMEFNGAIYDEAGCFDGGQVWINKNGIVDINTTTESCCIEAVWFDKTRKTDNGMVIPWTYRTDIVKETFMIYEEEEPYCEGFVFDINTIK